MWASDDDDAVPRAWTWCSSREKKKSERRRRRRHVHREKKRRRRYVIIKNLIGRYYYDNMGVSCLGHGLGERCVCAKVIDRRVLRD